MGLGGQVPKEPRPKIPGVLQGSKMTGSSISTASSAHYWLLSLRRIPIERISQGKSYANLRPHRGRYEIRYKLLAASRLRL
jgi:hypothetical protein